MPESLAFMKRMQMAHDLVDRYHAEGATRIDACEIVAEVNDSLRDIPDIEGHFTLEAEVEAYLSETNSRPAGRN